MFPRLEKRLTRLSIGTGAIFAVIDTVGGVLMLANLPGIPITAAIAGFLADGSSSYDNATQRAIEI